MKDTFTSGFSAGLTSGLAANVLSLLFGFLQFTTLRYADWTGIIIFGHTPPFSTGEIAFALAANIGFMGVLGIVFAYLIPLMSSANLLLKGWVFSTFLWLLIYAVSTLFKVDGTMSLPLTTAVTNMITASAYGLVLAQSLKKSLLRATASGRTDSTFKMMAPAMKPLQEKDDDTK